MKKGKEIISQSISDGPPLTFLLLYVMDSEEVDDPRCEVQSDVLFVSLDGQTVAVSIARSGHPSAVQQQWRAAARRTCYLIQGN